MGAGGKLEYPSPHKKKAAGKAAFFVRALERSDRRGFGETFPRALGGCPEDWGIRRPCPFAARKKQPERLLFLCERRDSNPYARRHQILSLAWLPITTRSQNPFGRLITGARHRKKPLEAVSTCIRKDCKCNNYLSFLQIRSLQHRNSPVNACLNFLSALRQFLHVVAEKIVDELEAVLA